MTYHLEQGGDHHVDEVIALIRARIQWMNDRNIRQWNTTDYLSIYSADYFQRCVQNSELFILRNTASQRVIGALTMKTQDARWHDGAAAYYLHNIVTHQAESGAGKVMIAHCETVARREGKQYLRLDCSKDNTKLNAFYASLGFAFVSLVREGQYEGAKRQKALFA